MTQPSIEVRHASHPEEVKRFDTETLRRHFLIHNLFAPEAIHLTFSQVERLIVGGAMPVRESLVLETVKEVGHPNFLDARELGAVNVGGKGRVVVDGTVFEIEAKEAVYVGRGAKAVRFESCDPAQPALFYLMSAPAHATYPTRAIRSTEGKTLHLGDRASGNERTIRQMLVPGVAESCQLVFGITSLAEGCLWNTMPAHVHECRSEIYFYFDLPEAARLFHFMGEPAETRHIIMGNHQAVVSPNWSIHSAVGTAAYSFVWGMAGENKVYTDIVPAPLDKMK